MGHLPCLSTVCDVNTLTTTASLRTLTAAAGSPGIIPGQASPAGAPDVGAITGIAYKRAPAFFPFKSQSPHLSILQNPANPIEYFLGTYAKDPSSETNPVGTPPRVTASLYLVTAGGQVEYRSPSAINDQTYFSVEMNNPPPPPFPGDYGGAVRVVNHGGVISLLREDMASLGSGGQIFTFPNTDPSAPLAGPPAFWASESPLATVSEKWGAAGLRIAHFDSTGTPHTSVKEWNAGTSSYNTIFDDLTPLAPNPASLVDVSLSPNGMLVATRAWDTSALDPVAASNVIRFQDLQFNESLDVPFSAPGVGFGNPAQDGVALSNIIGGGHYIAAWAVDNVPGAVFVYKVSTDSLTATQLTNSPLTGIDNPSCVTVSGDGTRVAFCDYPQATILSGPHNVWVYSTDGDTLALVKQFTTDTGDVGGNPILTPIDLAISENGQTIAFKTNSLGVTSPYQSDGLLIFTLGAGGGGGGGGGGGASAVLSGLVAAGNPTVMPAVTADAVANGGIGTGVMDLVATHVRPLSAGEGPTSSLENILTGPGGIMGAPHGGLPPSGLLGSGSGRGAYPRLTMGPVGGRLGLNAIAQSLSMLSSAPIPILSSDGQKQSPYLWVQGLFKRSHEAPSSKSLGNDMTQGAGVIGFSKPLSGTDTWGLWGSYGQSRYDWKGKAGDLLLTHRTAGAGYATELENHCRLGLFGSLSFDRAESSRVITLAATLPTAKTAFNMTTAVVRGNLDVPIIRDDKNLLVDVLASVEVFNAWLGSYSETGAGIYNISAPSGHIATAAGDLGLKVSLPFELSEEPFALSLQAGYNYKNALTKRATASPCLISQNRFQKFTPKECPSIFWLRVW